MEFKKAVDMFFKYLETLGRSPATITAYSNDLNQLQEFIGNINVKKINTKQLEAYMDKLNKKNYTNKTISRKLNSIKSFFNYLLEEKIILVDPSKAIPHPEIKNKLPGILTRTEYRSLRESSKNNIRIHTLIELMLQTGLRIGEISRLKLEHVQIKTNPPQLLIVEHGSSPMRIVELNELAVEALNNYLPQRLTVKGDEGFLFNTKTGSNMNIRNIRAGINRIFKKAEIENATVNDLRNTFIVKQLEKGVSLAKIAQIVGHKRFSSTEKYLKHIERKQAGKGEKIVSIE